MSDQPITSPRPDAATTPAVDDAFVALDQQLGVAANLPGADLDRCHSFRKAVREVAKRWRDGSPAPVMRPKKAAVQPDPGEPEYQSASEG